MARQTFTDEDLRTLLLAVGLAPTQDDYSLTFDELQLDSLARVELATRIEDRYGVALEIDADQSPRVVANLVNADLTGAVS
ncbi:acyl carrier protein [Microbispora sp. RL4-1S]|uniref:Acyl carrier protein n=1 Tax=Microbispora oryzae TaxID=2806554 RepID=A0A940WRY1_9ACTN|nr:acyl carrier protein [Microbispora oryzae]MBP2708258.1 acyl carrier protein [Microbispora oryzae]